MVRDIFKDTKGGEKFLSIWWFMVLAVIGGGIVLGVMAFYAADIDVRKTESGILASRVMGCVIKEGAIDSGMVSEGIFEKCNLDRASIDNSNGNYYLEIGVYGPDCNIEEIEKCNVLKEGVKYGVFGIKEDCKIKEKMKEAEDYPECTEVKVYGSYEGKVGILRIVTGSNQQGRTIFAR